MTARRRPAGITALSLFFVFGALMSGTAALMLLFPGSVFEPLWRMKPRAERDLASMGNAAVILMLAISAGCATAACGLWRVRSWGYRTALIILAVNLIGDLANSLIAHDWRTLIGVPVGGAMIAYLVSKRRLFNPAASS